ncbi:MAG: hypothetical protein ACTHJ8_12355 [Mucilaginibacter sp.]
MTNNLLYFPYINLPKTSWTTISMLYRNEVNAIVRDQYRKRPSRLRENMRQLIEAGLATQVFPYEYVYPFPNIDRAFLDLMLQKIRPHGKTKQCECDKLAILLSNEYAVDYENVNLPESYSN